jgi:hypothetical protein
VIEMLENVAGLESLELVMFQYTMR